jgi:hypothetical protein
MNRIKLDRRCYPLVAVFDKKTVLKFPILLAGISLVT